MSFQDWVSCFSVQRKELILPFPHYFLLMPRNREREKRKNKREREGFHLLLPCFSTTKREKEIKLLSSHLPFLIFGNREEREKFPLWYIYIYIYIFGRYEKRKKEPFCSSSVVPFLLPFICVWEASIIKLCSWLKKRKHPLLLMSKSLENRSYLCKTHGIALLPCFPWFRLTSVHLMLLHNGI